MINLYKKSDFEESTAKTSNTQLHKQFKKSNLQNNQKIDTKELNYQQQLSDKWISKNITNKTKFPYDRIKKIKKPLAESAAKLRIKHHNYLETNKFLVLEL